MKGAQTTETTAPFAKQRGAELGFQAFHGDTPVLEEDRPQGGQHQIQRIAKTVCGNGIRLSAAQAALAAAAVVASVAVEKLLPEAGRRCSDAVVVARQRRQVEYHDDCFTALRPKADQAQRAVEVVVAVDPPEPLGRKFTAGAGRFPPDTAG